MSFMFIGIGIPIAVLIILIVWFFSWADHKATFPTGHPERKKVWDISTALKYFYIENFGWISTANEAILKILCRLGRIIVRFVTKTVPVFLKKTATIICRLIVLTGKMATGAWRKIVLILKRSRSKPKPEEGEDKNSPSERLAAKIRHGLSGKKILTIFSNYIKTREDGMEEFSERIEMIAVLRSKVQGNVRLEATCTDLLLSEFEVEIAKRKRDAATIQNQAAGIWKDVVEAQKELLAEEEEITDRHLGLIKKKNNGAALGHVSLKEIAGPRQPDEELERAASSFSQELRPV